MINDTYGHGAGDDILRKAGSLLKKIIRAEDEVCRYGGEEFMYVLQGCALPLVKKRAEEIQKKISHINKNSAPPCYHFPRYQYVSR